LKILTLRPNPHTLGVTPLKRGEDSRPIRVRAKLEVFQQLAALNPTQPENYSNWQSLNRPHRQRVTRYAGTSHMKKPPHYRDVKSDSEFNVGPHERHDKKAFVYGMKKASVGDGYELELNTGLIVFRSNFAEKLELLDG
jgi:hypothetical protein